MTTLRYRYRIYPSAPQREMLARTFGCARVVWNDALARYKQPDAKYAGFPAASRALTVSKKTEEREWLREVSCVPLQQTLRHMDRAFQAFFNGLKGKGPRRGFPTWKKKQGRQSAAFTRRGFSLVGRKLRLAKIGDVRVRWSRELPSVPKTATVTLDPDGRYHVTFTVVKEDMLLKGGEPVGVDLGIRTFAALSIGELVRGPDLERLDARVRKAQRKLARCAKRSNRRKRAKLRVARLHSRISNVRRDFLQKFSTRLVREHSHISLEDLNVSGMVKNHRLARAISFQGWREFRGLVEQKCDRYGRECQIVNRWEPTSQVCSECGHRWGHLDLSVRTVTCEECGEVHDRDINAAKNIVAAGLAETENGRGEHVRRMASSDVSAALVEASTTGATPGIIGV